jgi:hypothetical protein
MGVDLNTNGVVMEDGNANRADVVKQGILNIVHDVVNWRENVARFFRKSFGGNGAKQIIFSPNLLRIHTWMAEKGKINMAGFSVCWSQCEALSNAMHEDDVSFQVENSEGQHRWHADKEGKTTLFGTVIQEEIMTKSAFYKLCPWFMLMYIHCVLRICNEVVVKGMCSVVARHASGIRGLIVDMYAKESIIDYNAPHRAYIALFINKAHITFFITKAIDHYFSASNYKRSKRGFDVSSGLT